MNGVNHVLRVPYKVWLPDWVFATAFSDAKIEENAKKYLEMCFPERFLIEVQGRFAICDLKQH